MHIYNANKMKFNLAFLLLHQTFHIKVELTHVIITCEQRWHMCSKYEH
jgi:hypothetical protein